MKGRFARQRWRAWIETRITPLVLRPPTKTATVDAQWVQLEDELHKIKRAGTWPSRLLARSLGMLPTILANVEVFCKAAALRFGTQRLGDQYGTLLAGAWCLTSGAVATEADALAMIDSVHCRIGSSENTQGSRTPTQQVHCRIGSSENLGPIVTKLNRVHCRIGSSEIAEVAALVFSWVHCRIGSSETKESHAKTR